MMDDLDNNFIERELKTKSISLSIDNNQYTVEFDVNGKNFKLYVILDESFPYEFPKVYIDSSCYDIIKFLPHVDSNHTLCCFDSSRVYPNIFKVEHILIDLFTKAKSIIEDDLNNENSSDILDEYTAYWNKDISTEDYYLIDELPASFSLLYCYIGNRNNFIHSDENYIKQFIENCDEEFKEINLVKCIYIPFKKAIGYIPGNTYEMCAAIKNNSNYYEEYCQWIKRNYPKRCIVIFSFPGSSKIICGFIQPTIPRTDGYRDGNAPLFYALSQNKQIGYEKIRVRNASQKRLFSRGGDGSTNIDKKICIIGCGSVGSNISKAFANCGMNKFTLIDNDSLSLDNIARHTCGFQHIGLYKADAVKDVLVKHNPHIICESIHENANIIIENKLDVLNSCDFIISTTASSTLEYHLISKFNEGIIDKPIAILWVEPYAICGHALILNKPQNVFKELFDDNLSFVESVVANPDQYLKREAGCQSTYMQYSGLNVEIFVSTFVKEYINGRFSNDKNYHFIWSGDINNSHNVEINDKWKVLNNNSVYIERIQ